MSLITINSNNKTNKIINQNNNNRYDHNSTYGIAPACMYVYK